MSSHKNSPRVVRSRNATEIKRFDVIVKANRELRDIRGQKLQPTSSNPTITVISVGARKKG